jgi:hypothetical protein
MNIEAFLDSLPLMGMGMLGIFAVTAVLVLSMYVLNSLFKDKK